MAAIKVFHDRLSAPADTVWIMARIAALLSPYYEKDVPQAVREMEAEDWAEALDGKPQWAIEKAVRWWKGADNPDRRKRPLEGDILARCRVEMDAVRAAERVLRSNLTTTPVPVKHREPLSEDRAAEIMKQAGFRPRKFGSE